MNYSLPMSEQIIPIILVRSQSLGNFVCEHWSNELSFPLHVTSFNSILVFPAPKYDFIRYTAPVKYKIYYA